MLELIAQGYFKFSEQKMGGSIDKIKDCAILEFHKKQTNSAMKNTLYYLGKIEDNRQKQGKRYKLKTILAVVLIGYMPQVHYKSVNKRLAAEKRHEVLKKNVDKK